VSTEPTNARRGSWFHGGRTWVFWSGLLAGWTVMGYALWGTFDQQGATKPPELLRWVLGSLVIHDALVAPVATIAGMVLVRVLPRVVRGPVIGALALSAIVWIFSIPLVRAYGRHGGNSSTLPQDYGRNVWLVIAAIWCVSFVLVAVQVLRRRRAREDRA